MRKIIFLLFTILAAWQVKAADKVRFVAEAADVVVSGDQVRLVFTVNSQDIKDFRAPSIKGFDVLMDRAALSRAVFRLSTESVHRTALRRSLISFWQEVPVRIPFRQPV